MPCDTGRTPKKPSEKISANFNLADQVRYFASKEELFWRFSIILQPVEALISLVTR